ncbi:hypothetical protein TRICHSKD4_5513 [Roseibium sp. TrichSKD4]|nr:hypothetical protein TRICHSKD4_5513 [Roseibium sp. TrichSKD4]
MRYDHCAFKRIRAAIAPPVSQNLPGAGQSLLLSGAHL